MSEERFYTMKNAILTHIQSIFEEAEQAMALQHQEKYALLEDACENASDVDELRVAFEQWYRDHSEDLEMEDTVDDLWEGAKNLAEEEFDTDFDEQT